MQKLKQNSVFQRRFWNAVPPLALAVVAFLLYWPSLSSDLIYDAHVEIFDEGFITSASNIPTVLSLKVLGLNLMLAVRPGTLLYLMLIAAVWGKNAFGYHLCSNLLHAANVALLFVFLRRLLAAEYPGWTEEKRLMGNIGAATGALLFALHPIAVETVASVSYCSDLLVTFFTLLALLAATAFHPENGGRIWLAGIVGVACCFVSVMCKESGLATALLLVVYWWLFRRKERRRSWVIFLGASVLITAAFLAARTLLAFPNPDSIPYLGGSLGRVFLIQPSLYVYMMGKLVWPVGLSADYAPDYSNVLSAPWALTILAIVVGLQAWLGWKSHVGALGVAIFWLGLVTVSNLIPLYRPMADRFYYLPMVGVAIQVTALLLFLLKFREEFWWLIAVLWLALAPMACLSVMRQSVFSSDFTMCSETLQVTPNSPIAHNGMGLILAGQGRLDEAIVQYQKALEYVPNFTVALNNLGNALILQGRLDDAQVQFEKILAADPESAIAQNNLGNICFQKGDFDEALLRFKKAIEINPHYSDAYYNLGNVYFQQRQFDDAVDQYRKAIELKPDSARAHDNLGNAYVQQHRMEEAVTEYQTALAIEPGNVKINNNLGTTYLQMRQIGKAIEQYQKTLAIDPNYFKAYNNLGIALSQRGDMQNAIIQFQQAIELNPKYIDAYFNLGNAYFQDGQLDEAIAQFKEALQLNPQEPMIQDRLKQAEAAKKSAPSHK